MPAATILLVEDNEDVSAAYVEVLRTMGYAVLAARTGEEALRVAEARGGGIDLLLTDVSLGGMSGLDLGRRLRAIGITPPVVVFSGDAAPRTAGEGIVAWLHKPLDVDELLATIERALRPR